MGKGTQRLEKIFTPTTDEINQGFTINAWHVSQSVNAFTGTGSFDIDISGSLTVSGSTLLSGSVQILGDKEITGSLDVDGDITSTGTISGGTGSFDTINARKLNITIESSSVIYNSGSNIFGDEPTDTQILSGSVYVPNLHYLAGNPKDTNLRIDEKLATSSFDSFSASLHTEQLQQDQNLDNVSASFATSQGVQAGRLDSLEIFTSSLFDDFVTEVEYSASIAGITSSLENSIATKLDTGSYLTDSSSFDTRIDSKLDASTYTTDSASFDTRINSKLNTSTFNSFSSSVSSEIDSVENTNTTQQGQINSLIAETSSYAKVDTNNTFTGDNVFSGSVQGVVIPLTVTSQTASMDCSQGNFFTLTLPTGSNTHIIPTNIQPGLTITLQVKQDPSDIGTVTFNPTKFDFPRLALPNATSQPGAKDILTFVSFDNQVLNGVISNDMI